MRATRAVSPSGACGATMRLRQLIPGAETGCPRDVVRRLSTDLTLYERGEPVSYAVGRQRGAVIGESERMILSFSTRVRQKLGLAVVAGLLAAGASARAEQATAPQLFVTGAEPDARAGTLTISGGNFGTRPFVTFELIPLDIRTATDTLILAVAPVATIPAGEYLLTVSRGPAPADNASLPMTLGATEPSPAGGANPFQPIPNMPDTPEPPNPSAEALPSLTSEGPAAQVGDRVISLEEVDREWRRSDPFGYLELIRRVYKVRQRILTTMVTDELLAREAAARGVSVEALLAEEVSQRVIPMADSAVVSLYLSLGNTRGATLDQMRPALRAWLERHSEPELAKMSFVEELKKVSTRAVILLEAPRVQVERAAQDATLGPDAAPVEIVAFGDFQSAEYARFAQAFSRVRDTFGDRVRFVFKHLPTLGPQSVAGAEAALCANGQDRFWAYHDALLVLDVVNDARIRASATAIGLNHEAFSSCVERREFRGVIPRALAEAGGYGIQTSPSFLVNGRLAPSPPPFLAPYEYFKLLIEEELSRLVPNRRR